MDQFEPTQPTNKRVLLRAGIVSLVVVVAGLVGTQLLNTSNDESLPPNPFTSQTSNLAGSLTTVGVKNNITVKKVTFNLPSEKSESNLIENIIYIVQVPNDDSVQTVTFDQAMTLLGSHNVNYYGYKYQTADGSSEKMNAGMSAFTQRFPGVFFTSNKARNDGTNSIANFEAANSMSFVKTDGSAGSMYMQKNSMYALVVNESQNTTITVVQPPVCGNGIYESGETCDDGNTVMGDGCGATCSPEMGWSCTSASPSVCTRDPYCGDGIRNGAEECDDGNMNDNDDCKNTCMIGISLPF